MGTENLKFMSHKKYVPIPGWNIYCKNKYSIAREALLKWVSGGKIRLGEVYDCMISSRKDFKKALKYCRNHEEQIRNDILLDSFRAKNSKKFWTEINKRRGNDKNCVNQIDGINDPVLIANIFKNKFSSITGNSDSTLHNNVSLNYLSCNKTISVNDVYESIKRLNCGIGHDGIHSNHLKFLNKTNLDYIVQFFNICFSYSYIPCIMLSGIINPRIKNKFGNIHSSENYREIMISSNLYKLLEYCLLPMMERYVSLSPYQYGYRPNTSTLLATAVFKEVLHKYNDANSIVYACFLDMSKAFERINHCTLIDKMKKKGMPNFIIKLFEHIFGNTSIAVRYGGKLSDQWKARAGVRQGGVTSAFLFSLYIDDILLEISRLPYSCLLGINKMNIQAYADDMVVYCPSASGLRLLLQKLEILLCEHNLLLNTSKTKIVVFGRKYCAANNIKFTLYGTCVEIVEDFSYLGCILNCNLLEKSDLERILKSFNKSVGSFIRKFSNVDIAIKLRLFDTLCMSMYGLELFINNKNSGDTLKKLGIAYHYALKRLLGLPKFYSNHYTCSILAKFTFTHMMNHKMLKFLFWCSESSSPCFIMHKIYFLKFSKYFKFISNNFWKEYEIINLLDNDLDAVHARIKFVQNHEPSSFYGVII